MWGTWRCNGKSFGTRANTSHCKSPADSREPQRVLCEYIAVGSGGFPEPPLYSTNSPPPPVPSLVSKNSQPLKIIKSGVLTAPSSTQAARTSPQMQQPHATRLTWKNLEHLCSNCKGDGQPLRSQKHGGNRILILKNVLPSSVPVCSSWAYTMHKLIYARHAYFTSPTPV